MKINQTTKSLSEDEKKQMMSLLLMYSKEEVELALCKLNENKVIITKEKFS